MEQNNNSYYAHEGNFFYKLLTRRYILQLKKYEHNGVSECIDFDNTNCFSVGIEE